MSSSVADSAFSHWMDMRLAQVESALSAAIPADNHAPEELHQGMRYGVLDGGKRVRPLLVFAAAESIARHRAISEAQFAVQIEPLSLLAASAVEMIHAYSLIHDDMPSMDNDVLRRGKPTVHVAYGEAGAMLVGDALQPLAFEMLAKTCEHGLDAKIGLQAVATLAKASGSRGMAGGQAIDLKSIGVALSLDQLRRMHELKTGALLRAAIDMGCLMAGGDPKELQPYGDAIGLAFQVIDDVLDVEADTATLGKTAGKDQAQNKPTYVSIMGLEPARAYAHQLLKEALAALAPLGDNGLRLQQMAELIVLRRS